MNEQEDTGEGRNSEGMVIYGRCPVDQFRQDCLEPQGIWVLAAN